MFIPCSSRSPLRPQLDASGSSHFWCSPMLSRTYCFYSSISNSDAPSSSMSIIYKKRIAFENDSNLEKKRNEISKFTYNFIFILIILLALIFFLRLSFLHNNLKQNIILYIIYHALLLFIGVLGNALLLH